MSARQVRMADGRRRRGQGGASARDALPGSGSAAASFLSYGLRIGVSVHRAQLLDKVRGRLPPPTRCIQSSAVERHYALTSAGRGRINVRQGRRRLARELELEPALDALESDLQLFVAEKAHDRLFVHAGVVGWRGRAIVLPGRSMSGKSTLVAALVRAGGVYYSDEYAVFDAAGRVHAYPRPLSLRGGRARWRRYAAGELGGRIGARPLSVGLIVVTRYRPGAGFRPRPLSAGRSLLALLKNTIAARSRTELALVRLALVTSGALTLEGARGEAVQAAHLILAEAARRTGRRLG